MRPDPIHLLDTSGMVLCRGLEVADVARPLDEHPPRIVLDYHDATCRVCRAAWERLQASGAQA